MSFFMPNASKNKFPIQLRMSLAAISTALLIHSQAAFAECFETVDIVNGNYHISTQCLHHNNLALAKYINKRAPEKDLYFLPSVADGSFKEALESVDPTRNAAALYTASNNLFLLNQSLSRHTKDQHHFLNYNETGSRGAQTASNFYPEGQLFASLDSDDEWGSDVSVEAEPSQTFPSYAIWGELVGAFSSQKRERQTMGFDPTTGGLIFAFEANLHPRVHVGGGAAYTHTHIHQHEKSGHADIDQGYLFAYGFWNRDHFYLDAALWGDFFQIHQVREIHMTGFEFHSTSDPRGWQIAPHLEVGLECRVWESCVSLQSFVMFDWAASWQQSYQEGGSGPFNMGQKSHYSSFLRSETGLRLFETIGFDAWSLVFQQKVSILNKKPFHVGRLNAFLVGSPGSFTVETLSTPQNGAIAEFAVLFEPEDKSYPFGTVAYQGEFTRAYKSEQISLEVCWNF